MKDFISEFRAISHLCRQIEQDFAKITDGSESQDSRTLIESILRNRDCLARIQQMTSSVLPLSEEWHSCRSNLDAKSRSEIANLVEVVRGQATRLHEMCNAQTQKVQAARDKLGSDLTELGKGTQYLKSINPAKNNYPKFIDSLY
jgi:hypothetical protein